MHPDCTLSRADKAILNMTPRDIERFWRHVNKAPGQGPSGKCWEWTGGKCRGYGRIHLAGMKVLSHRVAWFLAYGELPPPETPLVLHSCDNPPCVFLGCLRAGTVGDNNADRDSKGRGSAGRGDRHGSKTYPERWLRGDRHWSRLHPDRVLRGSKAPGAKTTESKVLEIRQMHAAGEQTKIIAQRFEISPAAVYFIVTRKTWAHVHPLTEAEL